MGRPGAFAQTGGTVAVKDGWYPDDDDDWRVGSAGFSYLGAKPAVLVVLTQHEPSLDAGVAVVNDVSSLVGDALPHVN